MRWTILLGNRDLLLHQSLLLLGVLGGHLGEVLLVLARLEAPADVLVGSLLEVLLDVVEGVLRDVGVTHVGVTPDGTDVGLSLAGEELNEGGLTGTVGAEARDAGGERELDGGARMIWRSVLG